MSKSSTKNLSAAELRAVTPRGVPTPVAETMRRMTNVGRFSTWSQVERHAFGVVAKKAKAEDRAIAACIQAANA